MHRRAQLLLHPRQHLQREFFIDNLLVRIHFIIVMIRWTGLARRSPCSRTSTYQTAEYDPLIKSQIASSNSLLGPG